MALYHFTTKPLSRGNRNTVGAVAYRSGCKLKDIQTGERFNYRNKDVQHVELVLPSNAPGRLIDLQYLIKENREAGVQALAQMAEAAEKRIDARVWREFEFALHRELTDEQNIALAKEFAQDQLCGRGMAVLLNFHFDRDEETGEYKPHCHALALTRPVTELGLSPKKEKEWNKREFLKDLREQWAAYSNFHLKLHGHEVQIDHRSYYDRGIEIEPQPKRGRGVLEQERRLQALEGSPGPFTERGRLFQDAQMRNLYRILRRPELVFESASKHHSTFMWGDVQKVLHRYIDEPILFQRMESRLKNSKELVILQEGKKVHETVYTTQVMVKVEMSLVEKAEDLACFPSHQIDPHNMEREIISAYQRRGITGGLSQEQEKAIQHVLGSGQLKCLGGLAGSGKTTLLGICNEVWTSSGYSIYGLAPTGKAAQNLQQSGIPSMTLHKFLKSFEDGRCHYNPNSVLVLDEAGMVDVLRFSKGDRIVFTRNNYGVGVRNGTIGVITEITSQKIQVSLDEGKQVSFAPHLNPYFDHGWAVTIHKAQGTTTDRTYVLASYDMARNLTYVAMTRHREDVQVFGSSFDFWRPEKVPEILSTSGEKLAARDYLDSESLEALMKQEDKLLTKVFTRISDELEAMGAVSKHVFWKVADQFLEQGHSPQKRPCSDFLSKSIREETRAGKVLPQTTQKGFWRESSSGFQNELERPSTKTCEEITSYIKEKLHELKRYEGLSIRSQAHEELHSYMDHIEKISSLRQALYAHNHALMKEAQNVLKEQRDHHVELGHGKEMDFGM